MLTFDAPYMEAIKAISVIQDALKWSGLEVQHVRQFCPAWAPYGHRYQLTLRPVPASFAQIEEAIRGSFVETVDELEVYQKGRKLLALLAIRFEAGPEQ